MPLPIATLTPDSTNPQLGSLAGGVEQNLGILVAVSIARLLSSQGLLALGFWALEGPFAPIP